jgi:hypothetical protein
MSLLALYAQRQSLRQRQAHHNRLPSQARTKLYGCPRCHAIFFTPHFISSKDGHTTICSNCSLIENLEATGMKAPYDGPQYDGPQYWTMEQRLRATAAEGLATSTQQSAPCAGPAPASDAPQRADV